MTEQGHSYRTQHKGRKLYSKRFNLEWDCIQIEIKISLFLLPKFSAMNVFCISSKVYEALFS